MIVNYNHNCSFIVLATVITLVNYDRKTLILTGHRSMFNIPEHGREISLLFISVQIEMALHALDHFTWYKKMMLTILNRIYC
jgi:hypothetical protein